jgi:hydroxylamine dehydrogenase
MSSFSKSKTASAILPSITVFALFILAMAAFSAAPLSAAAPKPAPVKKATAAGDNCIECHKGKNPGLYLQWKNSAHGEAAVGCIDCHGADKGDVDAFLHEGSLIATLVTPKDCGKCHEDEEKQASASHHAKAGEILESQDAFIANVAAGSPAAIAGCENCHGCKVKIDSTAVNRLSRDSWPNSGIGRINPDVSKGSCNACHPRHSFSRKQARQPDNCGKCHLGPDHPQREIYQESKHGITYLTNEHEMKLDNPSWVVGVDYYQAPTCATCHMSATRTQAVNHDVGGRISWTLRPAVSVYQDQWQVKRGNMKEVCSACHEKNFVNGQFYQYDAVVRLYNEKFGKPSTALYNLLMKKGLRERDASFADKVDWEYYELWHHEGRRARMGASMMGPDYTWWHGFYEVAQNFYFKFIPTALEYKDKDVAAYADSLLKNDPMHKWLYRKTADLKTDIRSGKLQKEFQKLFLDQK